MKNFLLISLIALLVASCGSDKQSFILSGKIKGIDQGEFLCFSHNTEWGTLDTIKVIGGEFRLTHPLGDTTIITLQYPNFMQTDIVAIPGHEVVLKANADNMSRLLVKGDKENEALTEFRHLTAEMNEAQIAAEATKFIRLNPESWASLALFDRYFAQAQETDFKTLAQLLEQMLKVRPNRLALRHIETAIGSTANVYAGKPLPQFEATTLKGQKISNATFRGKMLLITFWSTMSNELIYTLTSQRQQMRRLSDRIEQLNICLDVDTAHCQRVLRLDSIGGYNVCDCEAFNSPLVKKFGLKALPSNILVDSNGIIRARDVKPEELDR